MARKPAVSADEARRIAQQTVGKYPPSRPPRATVKRGTGLSEAEKKRVQQKQPVKVTKTAPKSAAEIARIKAAERQAKLNTVLKPLLPRGTAAGGLRRSPAEEAKYKANKSGARVLSADEARAQAQRKARDIEAAKDAKMRDAARRRDAKVAQDRPGPNPKAEIINRMEADARAAKALKEIKAREAARIRSTRIQGGTGRGVSGLRGPMGSIGGGGGIPWENR